MSRALIATALIVAQWLVLAVPAAAQSATPGSPELNVPPQQRRAIRDYVARRGIASVALPPGVTLAIGATIPDTVELLRFPANVAVRYRYVVVNNRTVMVDPGTLSIVQILD